MTAHFLRAAVALALWAGAALGGTPAQAAEQDTTNGVAPVKPGEVAATTETAAPTVLPPLPTQPQPAPPPPPSTGSAVQRYCDNIAAVAAEARFAWQTRKLGELQAQVTQRIAELEKKQGELESSLARRDEAMRQAQATLITVYAKMNPEAAAGQLALLDDQLAAAVLAQLNPRQSSAILNEIKPERASQLVGAMTSLPTPNGKTDGKKS